MHGSGGADGPVRGDPSCSDRNSGAPGRGAGDCTGQRPRHRSPHAGRQRAHADVLDLARRRAATILCHFAQVGLWAGFLVLLGALKTYNDAFYFSLVTFATLGYGDIVLAPGYRIFGALAATCGSLMLGWSTALIFAAISRAIDRGRA